MQLPSGTTASRRAALRALGSFALAGAILPGRLRAAWSPRRRPHEDEFLAAVREGREAEVARLLAADGALARARDGEGRSGFALAHLHGHAPIAALLREHGFEPDLVELCLAGEVEAAIALAGGDVARLEARPHPVGGSAVWAAARGGAGDLWRLQSLGVALAGCANDGVSGAVHAALAAVDPFAAWATALDLLGNGAPASSTGGAAALMHLAVLRDDARLVRMLVRKGAPLDARDAQGRTPLEAARAAGARAAAECLASAAEIARDHRSSRFAYDASGGAWKRPDLAGVDPALARGIVGSSHGNFDKVRELAGDDARLSSCVSAQDELAVEACAHTGRKDIVEFHLQRGAPLSLPTCFTRGDVARAKALLEEEPLRVHERGAHDFAVMWYPVIGECAVEGLELLLAHGAPVDQESYGTTALHWAAQFGDRDAIALLLDRGADVDAVGYKFRRRAETPLALAIRSDQPAAAALLRERGARAD